MKDYKKIWDNLSVSFEDAGHFVGYEGDEQQIRANGAKTAAFLRDVLQIGPNDRVLEIGCGIARIGRELAPYCGEWHGADISGNMIAHARGRTKDIPNIFLDELPESSLDIFSDNYFDCVYSSIVFMHLDKVEVFRYIKDALRVLAPGGRAYFDTYNILSPEAWQQFQDIVQNYPAGKRPGHVSQFSTPQELQKYLEEAGFHSIHIDGQNPQLVVALGRKPESPAAERPTSALRPSQPLAAPSSAAGNGATDADDSSSREWKHLDDNLRAKNRYITDLEQTLAAKNEHIRNLERLVRKQQRTLSGLPVRIAARLSGKR
ncbi:MAG: class I SAM-dependent methyltransferase [Chloroflexota bacterium]